MRSIITASAIAIFAVASFTSGAFAATGMTQAQPAKPAANSEVPKMHAHPTRLEHIKAELRHDNMRLALDREHGYLTKASYNSLKREDQHLRHEAIHVADMHKGKIPERSYVKLQGSVHEFDRDIHERLIRA